MNTIHAQMKVKHNKTVSVEIPIDKEIEGIAMRLHKSGKPCHEIILGWEVLYRPRTSYSYKTRSIDVFSGEKGPLSNPKNFVSPAEFTFGYNSPWKVVFSWINGDDKAPKKFVYGEDKLVIEPKIETMQLF